MSEQRKEWHVTPHDDGWGVQRAGGERPSGVHPTQAAAEAAAKKIAKNQGGGEVVIHRPDGTIRDKDTIPPANDPHPPKDTKH